MFIPQAEENYLKVGDLILVETSDFDLNQSSGENAEIANEGNWSWDFSNVDGNYDFEGGGDPLTEGGENPSAGGGFGGGSEGMGSGSDSDALFASSPWGRLAEVGFTSLEEVFSGVSMGSGESSAGGGNPFGGDSSAGGGNPFGGDSSAGGGNPFGGDSSAGGGFGGGGFGGGMM